MRKTAQQNISYEKSIKNWPKDDRPREKLFKEGEHKLSNTELLAILLRSGVKGQSAIDLARKIIQKFKTFRNLSHTDLTQWKEFKGLGEAKIAQIRAAIEIGRRFQEEEIKQNKPKIKSAKDVIEFMMPRMRDLKKEVFKVLLLNSQNQIIEIIEATEGTVNQAKPIIREVLQKALQYFSTSLICVHNHPSGDPKPSREDKIFTDELVQAGKVLQIKVLDHVIVGGSDWFSFVDEGEF
ncbi:MAG: DNA repair protein RadC [Candidatus Omnitrophica bacterium]|nr:DNA repair protein RadC [Candidatus Omnitrophota bacterium]